jgi:predicted N-acetyltransferase YhbS
MLLVLELDSKEEIEHHLIDMDAHLVCLNKGKVVGVIGWYKDTVNYARSAMGDYFPGEDAFWVGFFGVKKGFQGQGIGSTLIRTMEDQILKKGASEWWVSSVPEAKDFYQRKGFSTVCTGKINGNIKNFMKKEL